MQPPGRDTVIGGHMARTTRNLVAVNVLLALASLLVLANSWRLIHNHFGGPFPTSAGDLAAVEDPGALDRFNVAIDGDSYVLTGYEEREGALGDGEVTGHFGVLRLGDRLLLVKAESTDDGAERAGELHEIGSGVASTVFTRVMGASPDIAERLLPFMLDETRSGSGAWVMLLLFGSPLLLALWNLKLAIERKAAPAKHPVWKALAAWGDADKMAQNIDAEMRAGALCEVPDVTFTRSWVLMPSTFGLHALHKTDLVWVFGMTTQHRKYSVPTHKSCTLHLFTRAGKRIVEPVPTSDADQILAAFGTECPGTLVGYDGRMERRWTKDPHAFIRWADARNADDENPAT